MRQVCVGKFCVLAGHNHFLSQLSASEPRDAPPLAMAPVLAPVAEGESRGWWVAAMLMGAAVLILFADWVRLHMQAKHSTHRLQAEHLQCLQEQAQQQLQTTKAEFHAFKIETAEREQRLHELLQESGEREARLVLHMREHLATAEATMAEEREGLASQGWPNPLNLRLLTSLQRRDTKPKADLAQIDSSQLSDVTGKSPGGSLFGSIMGSVRGSQMGSRANSIHGDRTLGTVPESAAALAAKLQPEAAGNDGGGDGGGDDSCCDGDSAAFKLGSPASSGAASASPDTVWHQHLKVRRPMTKEEEGSASICW